MPVSVVDGTKLAHFEACCGNFAAVLMIQRDVKASLTIRISCNGKIAVVYKSFDRFFGHFV